MTEMVVAVDPGRDKCGVAVVDAWGRVAEKAVVDTADLAHVISELVRRREYKVAAVVVGDRTGARDTVRRLTDAGVSKDLIHLVDEHRSSEIGRRRYWRDNPPRGWRRLIPVGLQVPPGPYDDYVAVELACRYLSSSRGEAERVRPRRRRK